MTRSVVASFSLVVLFGACPLAAEDAGLRRFELAVPAGWVEHLEQPAG